MTLAEYQQRAFERPRRLLAGLLSPDRYSAGRRPPEQCWTVSGDNLFVSVSHKLLAARVIGQAPTLFG